MKEKLPAWPVVVGLALTSLLGVPAAIAQQPTPRSVAVTFDDLPFAHAANATTVADPTIALEASAKIQEALCRYSAPAIGFVNEDKVENLGETGMAILKAWNSGPFELGNHGFSHADINSLTLAQIEQEVDKGEKIIKPLAEGAGRSLRFFRFPFNHVGDTEDRRVQIEQSLASRNYHLAASTIDTSDYLFDQAYERAIEARDTDMKKNIEKAYLDYTLEKVKYYAMLNAKVLGYEPPEVLVLHLNRLNAAVMESILQIFEGLNYSFISLEEAQSDPAYRSPPKYATKFGPMWGYRWARERNVKVDGRLEKEPPEWLVSYAEGNSFSENLRDMADEASR